MTEDAGEVFAPPTIVLWTPWTWASVLQGPRHLLLHCFSTWTAKHSFPYRRWLVYHRRRTGWCVDASPPPTPFSALLRYLNRSMVFPIPTMTTTITFASSTVIEHLLEEGLVCLCNIGEKMQHFSFPYTVMLTIAETVLSSSHPFWLKLPPSVWSCQDRAITPPLYLPLLSLCHWILDCLLLSCWILHDPEGILTNTFLTGHFLVWQPPMVKQSNLKLSRFGLKLTPNTEGQTQYLQFHLVIPVSEDVHIAIFKSIP